MRTPLYILLFTLFFSVWNSHSQTSDSLQKTNIRFASKNELGGLIGMGHIKGLDDVVIKNPEWALELTSTNGIQMKQWFLGIGAGVRVWERDFTFPLFFHVSLDDLWKSRFFLHTDIGAQLGIRKTNHYGDRETGGFYAAYGLGYNFPVKKQNLYLKASICHQRADAEGAYSGLGPGTLMESYKLNYLFFRFSVGLKITK
jgi:hypothetical protein